MSRPPLKSSNPFEFEEEEDDFVCVPKEGVRTPFDDKRQRVQHMIHASEDRQLESTQRALASIYESEAMGTATAEELLRQKEVLNNIERKTDDINSTLTVSQRHINNIKSVFGGIKNWWQKKDTTQPQSELRESSPLDKFVKKNNAEAGSSDGQAEGDSYGSGVGSSYGGRDVRDADLDSRFMAGASSSQYRTPGSGLQYVQPITRSAREEEVDRNLGMMSDGMGRLKMLALGLGEEIEAQNEQLERITPKVDRSNDLLENQNRQMGRILKR